MPKYVIKNSRYINGTLVHASPEFPATIELPEGTKIDKGLIPVDDPRAGEIPKPHFVPTDTEMKTGAQVHSTPTGPTTPTGATETKPTEPSKTDAHGKPNDAKGKRASDKEI